MIDKDSICTATVLWPVKGGVQKNYRFVNLSYGEAMALCTALEDYHQTPLGLEIEILQTEVVKEV